MGVVGCFGMVFVLGILAAIAIPNFFAMQLRAKRAEAPYTLDGIRTAEFAHIAQTGRGLDIGPCPPGEPGRELRPWGNACLEQLRALGWTPDEQVRCSYEVRTTPPVDGGEAAFEAVATCDVDGDGIHATYSATHDERAHMTSPNNVY